jgi:hypothetical protein
MGTSALIVRMTTKGEIEVVAEEVITSLSSHSQIRHFPPDLAG